MLMIKLYMHKNSSKRRQQESSDDDDSSNELDTDNSPKYIPVAKLPDRLKTKKIIINISDTQYPIIQEIAEELGWIIQHNQGFGDWDVWWTDREITPDTLFKMNLYQKINHYPGIYVLARKNLLGLNLMAMKEHFPTEYDFFPQTWIIPIQFSQFRNYYESVESGKVRTYIVKPEALSQGRGIFLTRNIEDIMTGYKYVVQRYIKKPFLIDGLKFDLRIYVLLSGTQALRIYVYQDGLARFATQRYQEPNQQNLSRAFIHLTNYSLNKCNPHYIYNKSQQEVHVGHKRTLKAIYQKIAKMGYDVDQLKNNINDIIIKTIISGLPPISHQYRYCQPEQYENNMCFHILGFDIMLTEDLKPILIEINHTPSFETATPLDYMVKKNLVKDTLKLMRIKPGNKKVLFEKSKVIVKRRIQTGKREIVKGEQREILMKKAQEERDIAEEGILGGWVKIYPPPNQQEQKYQEMIRISEKVHKSSDEARKRLIKEEQQKYKLKKQEEAQNDKKSKEKHKDNFIKKNKEKLQDGQIFKNRQLVPERSNEIAEKTIKFMEDTITQPNIQKNNPNFRSKLHNRPLPMTTPVDQMGNFSEIILKFLAKKEIKAKVNTQEQAYFSNAKDSIVKRSRGSLTPVPLIKANEESQSKGKYVKPKPIQIGNSRSYKLMEMNPKSSDHKQAYIKKEETDIHNKYSRKRKLPS